MTETKKLYGKINDVMILTSLGRNSALKIGELAGAKRKIGKSALYDLRLIDEYLCKQAVS